jgi:DNA polymerase-4
VVSESRETTFDQDVTSLGELERILDGLVRRLCGALVEQDRGGRTIGIKVRLDDFSTHTRARTVAQPVNSAEQVGAVALDLLRRFDPPRPVRLLGVRVAGLEPARGSGAGQLKLAM